MAINSTANIRSNIDTSVSDTTSSKRTFVKSFNNGSLYSFTQGEGTGNINNGAFLSGSIKSGESVNFDMRALVEEGFGTVPRLINSIDLGAFNVLLTCLTRVGQIYAYVRLEQGPQRLSQQEGLTALQ